MALNTDIGIFGIGETLLGGITSAFGNYEGGQAQKKMYDYQAGIARLNKQISDQNATYARQIGEVSAANYGLKAGQQMGRIKSAQASQGLDVNSGSAAQARASTAKLQSNDIAMIRSNAAKTAYNYTAQGVQFGAQAQLDTMAGRNAAYAGMISADSSLVGMASSVSSQWLSGQRLGLWGS